MTYFDLDDADAVRRNGKKAGDAAALRQVSPDAPHRRAAGGRVAVVAEFLAKAPATTRQLMAGTGYSRTSVEVALSELRRDCDECLANFRRERKGPTPKDNRPAPPEPERPKAPDRVKVALAARTPLEQAWGATA